MSKVNANESFPDHYGCEIDFSLGFVHSRKVVIKFRLTSIHGQFLVLQTEDRSFS